MDGPLLWTINYVSEMVTLASAGERQGVFFFVAVYALLVCSWSLFCQLRILRWPNTRGKLSAATLRVFGAGDPIVSERMYRARTLYEYSVDGNAYQGHRLSPWLMLASHNARFVLDAQLKRIESSDDGSVTVYFDPAKPAKSFLTRPGLVGLLITVACAVGPAALYVLDYPA